MHAPDVALMTMGVNRNGQVTIHKELRDRSGSTAGP